MSLKDEILAGEGYALEFKLVPNENRAKYLKTAVAFANGKGGRVLFGVANDRSVVGVANDRVFPEMDAIVNSLADSCEPKIPVDIGVENIDGKAVIVLDVFAGARPPYHLKAEGPEDGVYVRVGATTRRADDATRCELALLAAGRSCDGEPCPNAKIDDKRISALCSRMYRLARQNCTTEAKRRAVRRVTPEQLQSWGVIAKSRGRWVASNAYAILTGDPAFAIRLKCGVFKGDTKAVFVDRREFTGSIIDLIDEGFSYILAKINMGCVFKGVFRQDVYELPPDELRELVVNAFAHRNYADHDAPVFIAVYDGRVEITSPGGLPRGQTPERAVAGYSKVRNPVLAKALNYMNFIEEWGSGLLRVNEAFGDRGLRALGIEDAVFATTMSVYRSGESAVGTEKPQKSRERRCRGTENGTEKLEIAAKNRRRGTESGTVNGTEKNEKVREKRPHGTVNRTAEATAPLSPLSAKIVNAIKDDGSVTYDELGAALGISRRTIGREVKALSLKGVIRRVGPDKGGHWEVTKP